MNSTVNINTTTLVNNIRKIITRPLDKVMLITALQVVSAMMGEIASVCEAESQTNRASAPLPSVFCASSKNNHNRSGKKPTTPTPGR